MPMRSDPVRGWIVAVAIRGSTASKLVLQLTFGYSTDEATMRVVPARRAVMTPDALTVATISLSLLHESGRPSDGTTLFAVSRSVMVGWDCAVTVTFWLAGDRLHAPSGMLVMVTAEAPTIPSDSAEIVALPTASAVTLPLWSTDAIEELLDPQRNVRPVIVLPSAFRALAVNCRTLVTRRVIVAGDTETVAGTSGVTVTCAVPCLPSATAETVVCPTATPITWPLVVTVATDVLADWGMVLF
jgi:hypothetical protein